MRDPGIWSLCFLTLGLLIKGTASSVASLAPTSAHLRRIATRCSVVLIGIGLVLGLWHDPVAVRPDATHPTPQSLTLGVIDGSRVLGRNVARRWEANGVNFASGVQVLAVEEACARYPMLPFFCVPPGGIPDPLDRLLRASAADVGLHEVASACSGDDAIPLFLLDRFDNVLDLDFPDDSAREIELFRRSVTVSTTGRGDALRLLLKAKDANESLSLAVKPGVPLSGRYPLGGHAVRFRVLPYTDSQGVLRVSFVDVRLECT